MSYRPPRAEAFPGAVTDTLKKLGAHIATARVRRQWRQEDLAAKAGITHVTLRKIETGAPGTSIGAYLSVLWALGLHEQMAEVARPASDPEGEALLAARLGQRVRRPEEIDDAF